MNSVLLGSVRQSGQQIVADFSAITNQYSSNSLEIAFSLDASNVGFTSVALEVLIEDKCLNTVIPIKESKVTLPGYITQYSGILRLALAIIDDEQVITTNAIELEIIPSVNPAGATPPPIQIWQQQVSDFMEAYLQAEIDPDLKKLLEQAKKSMDDATKAVNDAKKSLSNADEAITIANTASIAANTAAKSANDITNEVKTKLEAGEFVGPKGPQGTPGGADGLSYVEDKLQLMQGEEKLGEPVLIKIKGVDIPLLKEPPTDGKVGDYFTLEGGGDPTLIGEVVSNIDNNNPKAAPNAKAVREAIENVADLREVKGSLITVDVKQGLPALAIEGKTHQDGALEIHGAGESLNLLKIPNQTTTVKGVTITVADGVITSVGKPTEFITVELCAFTLEAGTYYLKTNVPNMSVGIALLASGVPSVAKDQILYLTEKRTYTLHFDCSSTASGTSQIKPMISVGKDIREWQPYGHRINVKRTCGTSQLDVIYPLSSPLYEGDKIQPDGKIVRKNKTIVFTGKEDFKYNNSAVSLTSFYLQNMPQGKASCSHLTVRKTNEMFGAKQGISTLNSNGTWMIECKQTANNLEEFKAWIIAQYNAGTPVTIVVETSNPTVEYINPSAQLELVDGINTVQDVGLYPSTLDLYYSKSGMPIFNSVKPQERVKIVSQKIDYFYADNEDDINFALNMSNTLESSSHYTLSINIRKSGLSLGGGVWCVEGYKTDDYWEWQIARRYDVGEKEGLTEYKRSKVNGIWKTFV